MSFWESYFHLVWATKERMPIIDAAGETLLRRSFWETCKSAGVMIRAIGIMPDHVHLALSIPPRWSVSDLVKELKISSTHAINTSVHLPYSGSFYWQHGFGMFTFGEASLTDIVHYIEHQREHHATQTIRPRFERAGLRESHS